MKKNLLATILSIFLSGYSYSQKPAEKPVQPAVQQPAAPLPVDQAKTRTIHDFSDTYIFDSNDVLGDCDAQGNSANASTSLTKGYLFSVVKVVGQNLVITLNTWTKGTNIKYNGHFYLLSMDMFDNDCSVYTPVPKASFNFGTLITPFKLRFNPFVSTANINIGGAGYYQHRIKNSKNVTYGFVLGLSVSSLTLDSSSTNGYVKTSTDRPAITPSFHGIISYKNISLTAGFGFDYLNQTSAIEKSWVYKGKAWLGLGLGISLFNNNSDNSSKTTQAAVDQTKSK